MDAHLRVLWAQQGRRPGLNGGPRTVAIDGGFVMHPDDRPQHLGGQDDIEDDDFDNVVSIDDLVARHSVQ
jgi:hypothetical protein